MILNILLLIVWTVLCFKAGCWWRKPRASFNEPSNELDFSVGSVRKDVHFASPVIPKEAFKESKSIDDFIKRVNK